MRTESRPYIEIEKQNIRFFAQCRGRSLHRPVILDEKGAQLKTNSALTDIRILEELSYRDSFVHRRHPAVHLLVTLGYIVTVASYGKYAFSAMLPMLLYPVFLCASGEIPPRQILRRMLPALPLVLGVGLFNPIFDRRAVAVVMGISISAGWVSLLSIVLRCCLCVAAALLLVGVSGMRGVSSALIGFRVPRILVVQLQMTFRYIHVLGEEAGRITLAYQLRAPQRSGIAFRQWGPLAGQWLLRTLNRAGRVHQAMLCRGYDGSMPVAKRRALRAADIFYMLAWAAFFIAARAVDIPRALGALVMGIGG